MFLIMIHMVELFSGHLVKGIYVFDLKGIHFVEICCACCSRLHNHICAI